MEQMDIKQMLKRVACAALAVIIAAGAAIGGTSVDAEAAVGRKEGEEGVCGEQDIRRSERKEDGGYIEYKTGYYMTKSEYNKYKNKELDVVPEYADPNIETYDCREDSFTGLSYKECEKKIKKAYKGWEIVKEVRASVPLKKKKVTDAFTYRKYYVYYTKTCSKKGFKYLLPAQRTRYNKEGIVTHAIKVKVRGKIGTKDNLKDLKRRLKSLPSENTSTYLNLKKSSVEELAETTHNLLYKKSPCDIVYYYKYDNAEECGMGEDIVNDINDYLMRYHGATPFYDVDREEDWEYEDSWTGLEKNFNKLVDPTKSTEYYVLTGYHDFKSKDIFERRASYTFCSDHPDFIQSDQKGFDVRDSM